jgi:CO dehydrogenase/acetyl-CoA synthase beta subunit
MFTHAHALRRQNQERVLSQGAQSKEEEEEEEEEEETKEENTPPNGDSTQEEALRLACMMSVCVYVVVRVLLNAEFTDEREDP